jgi:xylan 1,4-beta-xylosidase
MIITSPPSDYADWEEICYRYTEHIVERYGEDVVKNWYLQCFNEPDIPQFFMKDLTPSDDAVKIRAKEYCKLYAGFERGIRRVSKNLFIGGPGLAGSDIFLDHFLAFTKKEGLQLDYVCVHSYGTGPSALNTKAKRWDVRNNTDKIDDREAVMRKYYPTGVELVVDEWGMASNGFYNIDECPAFIAREDHTMSVYYSKLITRMVKRNTPVSKLMICLSGQHEMTQDFSGFRNFFTLNFIKKPIYNAYVLASKLGEEILESEKIKLDYVTLLPTRSGDHYAALLTYSTDNFDGDLPDVNEKISLYGLDGEREITVWRIDETHTNPYGVYVREGYTKDLTPEQLARLKEEGTLKPADTFTATPDADGIITFDLKLTNNCTILITF